MLVGTEKYAHEDVTDKEDRQSDLVLVSDKTEIFLQTLEPGGGVVVSVVIVSGKQCPESL